MSNILDTIVAKKQVEVAERQEAKSLQEVMALANEMPTPRPFKAALLQRIEAKESAVIAEIKKASPSKGVIREDFKPGWIASRYAASGASCLSVLTDEDFFQGHDTYLQEAKAACDLPVLRKDFVIDAYQIYEAKALGADCILLIVAILSDEQLQAFHQLAKQLGLSVLVEVHDEVELERALALQPDILGVNNRNLKTFEVSLETTIRLSNQTPNEIPIITESGIHSAEDVKRMHDQGIFGFLVGEAFMRQPDPGQALAEIFAG